jgi:hypothetical protein
MKEGKAEPSDSVGFVKKTAQSSIFAVIIAEIA